MSIQLTTLDSMREISYPLSYKDTVSLLSTSKFSNRLLNDQAYWMAKLWNKYGIRNSSEDARREYRDIESMLNMYASHDIHIYYTNDLEKDFITKYILPYGDKYATQNRAHDARPITDKTLLSLLDKTFDASKHFFMGNVLINLTNSRDASGIRQLFDHYTITEEDMREYVDYVLTDSYPDDAWPFVRTTIDLYFSDANRASPSDTAIMVAYLVSAIARETKPSAVEHAHYVLFSPFGMHHVQLIRSVIGEYSQDTDASRALAAYSSIEY